jgi:ABC-2 type transport system permease protein
MFSHAASDESPATVRYPFLVLVRYRLLQLRNAVDQQLQEAPVRVFAVVLLLVIIWAGLYFVLSAVLRQVGRWELIALVAKQQIFVHFFLVLAVMLAFSNAILAFSSLFGREEAGHLLGMPASVRQVVCMKWLEGMLLSSWSFLLLGVPLMLAVANNTTVEWYYYPLFVGHFLGFVIIPGTLGLLVAWAVAMWAPRRPLMVALWCGGIVIAAVGIWGWSMIRDAEIDQAWLERFYAQLSFAQQPFFPSTWSAKGVFAAMERRADVSLLYLTAVLANGAFLSWITINVIGGNWARAYSRARHGRARALIRDGWFTAAVCDLLFFYLPKQQRVIMLKDLRSFARDPTQWTQMVIMIGLLILYAVGLKRLPLDLGDAGMRTVVAFLNLATVCLILATFTSRFVFPLLSLESHQLWLLSLLPVRRASILLVKFAFSLTMTGLSGLLVMGLAVRALALPTEWAWLQIGVCLSVCVGLSGLSVGLGARFPVIGQRNPARIASGFGGTFNLIASMLFVAIELAGLAAAGLIQFGHRLRPLEQVEIVGWIVPALLGLGVVVAFVSLATGMRHFERLEC